jgi:hypothetical protein
LAQGKTFGKEQMTHVEGEMVVRQAVMPTSFACCGCGLSLEGYARLAEAGVGDQYHRTTTYSPAEYLWACRSE